MEEGMGSGDVIKKKSSSGCLIIKKKLNGVSGFGGSRTDKKRSRLVLTDSGSSEELVEPVRRRVREDIIYERRRSGIEDCRMLGFERKRGGIDVFEFDEYEGFDGKKMRMDYMDDRLKLVGRSEDYQGFETGSSRNVVFDGMRGSMSGGKSRYDEEDDDDESHVPLSVFRDKRHEAPKESIRLQGKNGVLKVMVNKKKQQGFPVQGFDYPRHDERMSSRSEAAIKKNKELRPSFYSDSKRPENPVSFKTEKKYLNSRKALQNLSSKAEDNNDDSSSGESEKSLKQETSEQVQKSKKTISIERKRTTPTEFSTPPSGGKESKVKRGNGTEKQLLREKIRSMLLDRGWKIDYRPRRNRDYLDAVYINPAGTAYWSIIKAYDALQKQLEEQEDKVKPCDESTSFTPLPEEILSKLTRQTRKKIERELKKKKRDAICSRNAKEVTRRESANCTDSEQQEEKLGYNRKHNHKPLRGRLHEADHVSGNDSSDGLYQVSAKKDTAERQSSSHIIQGRKSGKIGRCTLLVRNSDKGLSEAEGYVPYTGKRTILSWLVDSGIVQTSEKVQYMNGRKTRVMLEGWITKDGIHCGCCSKILTISKFEIHAGSKQRQPFLNIYLESGISLLQCQIDAWNKQEESEREAFHSVDVDGDDPNDDTCGLCGDGGDLICCDGCPSTFHQSCLDIKMLPTGDWHCPNCTCKFCGFAGQSNAKADDITDSSLLLCSLCEKKYHQSCSQVEINLSVNSGDATNSFCGKNCQEIFSHVQKLLGVRHELESGFSWSLVHRLDPASERLHLGFPQRVECNSKLAVALSVMDECFLPIVDRRSGINLMHNVLYNRGSNFSRLSYSAFYTAILEKGDEIISAASVRIRGMQLAEMPFIGTRHIYRRQGMCRRLLSAIESALATLKVEKFIIPAIAEHMNTWTQKFNFSPLVKPYKQEMRSINMLVFPRTDMLQKPLIKREITEGSINNNPGSQSTQANEDSPMLSVLGVSETDSSPKHDLNKGDSPDLLPLTESSSKSNALLSSSQIAIVPLIDVPAICGSLVSSCELKHEPAMEMAPAINSISINNRADTTVNFESTCPSNEHPSTFVVHKAEAGQSVKDHTQSFVDGVITHEEKAKATSGELIGDSLCEISNVKIEEDDATVIQNSVSVHNSISRGTSECTLVESDMSNHTAVDLDNTCKVHIDNTSANLPKDSVEQLCAMDDVEDDALGENSLVNIKEDATAIQNSIHGRDCESRHVDSNMSNLTAVDLTNTFEVHVIDTSVNHLRDAAEKLSEKDIFEDETLCKTVSSTIEEDATPIQNSVSAHDSVSLGASGSTHIDFDMTNLTAYDLDSSCEVNANDTSFNFLKDSGEQLPSMDFVKDDILPETFGSNIEEDATAIQNSLSVHHSACKSTQIDSEMTNPSAVDLDHSCKVHLNDTFVNSPKDSAEHLSSKDIAEDDDTLRKTFSGIIKENATAIHNSVSVNNSLSLGTCEGTHVDLDINLTAVHLGISCEVNVNDSCVKFQKDSAEHLSSKDVVQNDTLCEAISDTIKEDATALKNSLSVQESVSLGAHESNQSIPIDSDMANPTTVDSHKSFENVNDTSVNCPKDAVEHLSAKDNVEDDSLCETSAGNIKEELAAIQNSVSVQISVSRDTFESTHIDFDMSKRTAVDLDNTCKVNLNDTYVNSPKESVEQSSTDNTVKEDATAIGIITQNGGNVVDGVHEVELKTADANPVMDSFHKTLRMNNTSQAISEDPSELSSTTDVAGDERKGDLKNSIIGDAQEVDVKIAFIEPIVDSVCDTYIANSTYQVLTENVTGSTSDEQTKNVKSDSFPSNDMKND